MGAKAGTRSIWSNGVLATMDPDVDNEYGLLKNHRLSINDRTIEAIVPQTGAAENESGEIYDLQGALVTPGFIDCHTHLLFGGNRSREWEQRLAGLSYSQIAANGGGIGSTVEATRKADFQTLYRVGRRRLETMMAEGVTTVEIKSGYGLDLENEEKLLRVAAALGNNLPVDVAPTLLAAHTIPEEYRGRPDEYVDLIINDLMPVLAGKGLFESVDGFCEDLAFNLEQTERIFKAARSLGLPVKGHCEQLSNRGGSALVAGYDGLSTDHLEHLDEVAVKALAGRRTVATLLPTAYYFLRDTHRPPVDLLRRHQVPMAVATDFNPGTSPFTSLRLAMNMAATLFGLTASEVMAGVTRQAARALGRENIQGRLKAGYQANLAVWAVERPVDIFYELSWNPLIYRVFNGLPLKVDSCS